MLLAASWTQNFASWPHFANWINNSNWASLVIGLALPGAVLVLWHHSKQVKLHRETRCHAEELHAATRKHAEDLHTETRAHAERLAK